VVEILPHACVLCDTAAGSAIILLPPPSSSSMDLDLPANDMTLASFFKLQVLGFCFPINFKF
jgi:hypothetical protein